MTCQTLEWGNRKTRIEHQCFDCYRKIPPGTDVSFFTGVMDGSAYTLYFHPDCAAANEYYRAFHGIDPYDYDGGFPPLADMISDNGEFAIDVAMLRGHFPHVACRLEFSDQKAAIRVGEWEGL